MAKDISEYSQQRAALLSAVGAPGSGALRYTAAMYFYKRDEMTAQMLEIYRSCSKFDHEDPVAIAEYESIPVSPLPAEEESGQ